MTFIDLGPHTLYIVTAYGAVSLAVLGLIAYAAIDARRVQARLAALEARGIRRRSGEAPT